jgi:hypothetical protein
MESSSVVAHGGSVDHPGGRLEIILLPLGSRIILPVGNDSMAIFKEV